MKYWCLVLVVLLFCNTFAQECLEPCDLPLKYCTHMDYPVPSFLNVTLLDQVAGGVLGSAKFEMLKALPACYRSIQTFMCTYVFPGCRNDTSPITVAKPCVSMCTNVHTACEYIIRTGGFDEPTMAMINCSATSPDGSPFWDSNSATCQSLTNINPLPCFNPDPVPTFENNTNPDGGCIKYNTSLTPLTSMLCSPYVSTEIFAPTPDPKYLNQTDSSVGAFLGSFLDFYPIIPQNCFKRLASLLCRSSFTSCVHVNSSYHAPSPPCRSFCEETMEVCKDFFTSMASNGTLLSCDQIDPRTAKPSYPSAGLCINAITPPDAFTSFYLPPAKCPSVMGYREHPAETEARCGYPCPDRTFTSEQMDNFVNAVLACASISFILLVFLAASQLLIADRRRFPANFQLLVCFITCMMNIGLFIGGHSPRDTTWCKDRGTYSNMNNNARCGIQAFVLTYFGLASICLTTLFSVILFCAIVLQMKIPKIGEYMKYFHIFIWGFPLPFVITALSLGRMGYLPMLPYCFITFGDINELQATYSYKITLDWALYFIPSGFLALVSLCLFIAVIWRIIWVNRHVRGMVSGPSGVSKHAQRRVGAFVVILSMVTVIIFEWRIQIESSKKLSKSELTVLEWFTCKILSELGHGDASKCPEENSPTSMNYGHLMLIVMLSASLGILQFAIFGFDKDNYKMWPMVYNTVVYTKDYKGLWHAIKNGVKENSSVNKSTTSRDSKTKQQRSANSTTNSNSDWAPNSNSNSNSNSVALDEASVSIELPSNREVYEI